MKRLEDKSLDDDWLNAHRDRLLAFEVLHAFARTHRGKHEMPPATIADKALIEKGYTHRILTKLSQNRSIHGPK